MLSKYRVNQLVFLTSSVGYCALFWLVSTRQLSWAWGLLAAGASTLCLHYLLNLVHIGAHNLLSKKRRLNSLFGNLAGFFGGVTFADFRLTHLQHHRYLDDPERDPDYFITNSGPWFTIPFKIFYHDVFFFRKELYKSQNSWKTYLATRLGQIGAVALLFASDLGSTWITYWLLPMLGLGLLNGLFLFYFPHYIPRIERSWRQNPKFWNAPLRLLIDVSRVFHEHHHDRIQANLNYYPVLATLDYWQKHKSVDFKFHHRYTKAA